MHEPVFVGRARELADLDRRLGAARTGRGALVLVEGEAGAGKTALAQELADRARAAPAEPDATSRPAHPHNP